MRGALLIIALLLGACSPSGGIILNGHCRCGSGQLCVRQVAESQVRASTCQDLRADCAGCGCFVGPSGSCWASPDVAGLCLCTGPAVPDSSLASAK